MAAVHHSGPPDAPLAVILGPVSPAWDDGAFCRPLSAHLLRLGYQVAAVDTLSVCTAETIDAAAVSAGEFLRPHNGKLDLLAGYALGGTVAMQLPKHGVQARRLLTLSSPGFADPDLRARLQALIDRLRAGRLDSALDLLAQYVTPLGEAPPAREELREGEDVPAACHRMARGFELLLQSDAREDALVFEGRLLCLVGERSQLARPSNQGASPHCERHGIEIIADAGMRILADNPHRSLQAVGRWLGEPS